MAWLLSQEHILADRHMPIHTHWYLKASAIKVSHKPPWLCKHLHTQLYRSFEGKLLSSNTLCVSVCVHKTNPLSWLCNTECYKWDILVLIGPDTISTSQHISSRPVKEGICMSWAVPLNYCIIVYISTPLLCTHVCVCHVSICLCVDYMYVCCVWATGHLNFLLDK